ncbi:YjfB family protein [Defluviitalea saccharophila]|uniref:YjfB family protein n=1 Tax=Defluviitalea saccharophila TaxID=879970 RepID=A0ABZ2Y6B2_9FIRM|nr:putative motility protein [Candidatus Epulonipiscium sp.]
MDIAALSSAISMQQLGLNVSVAVMNLAKDQVTVQSQQMMQMLQASTSAMEISVNPHIGGTIDIKI